MCLADSYLSGSIEGYKEEQESKCAGAAEEGRGRGLLAISGLSEI